MIYDNFNSFPRAGRIIGIDWGTKRIGIAISDPDQKFVFPRPTLFFTKSVLSFRRKPEQGLKPESAIIQDILEIIKDENIKSIIIGLPLYLDGTESETTSHVRKFASALTMEANLPIFLFDESLTSFAAEQENIAGSHKKTKNLDSIAAKILLENALAHISRVHYD